MDFRKLDDVSEIGGEGGVAVEDASVILAGGVVNMGEETVEVPGDRSKISGVCGVDGLRYRGVGFLARRPPPDSAFRSLSWTISVSIFRSDNSSRRR